MQNKFKLPLGIHFICNKLNYNIVYIYVYICIYIIHVHKFCITKCITIRCSYMHLQLVVLLIKTIKFTSYEITRWFGRFPVI